MQYQTLNFSSLPAPTAVALSKDEANLFCHKQFLLTDQLEDKSSAVNSKDLFESCKTIVIDTLSDPKRTFAAAASLDTNGEIKMMIAYRLNDQEISYDYLEMKDSPSIYTIDKFIKHIASHEE